MLKVTLEAWDAYWAAPVAKAVDPVSDLPAIRRLFTLYDERERCYRSVRVARMVQGSKGQPVVNPLYRQMSTLDAEIRALEDRYGLNPAARARLGIALTAAVAAFAALVGEGTDDEDDEDPREGA